MDIGDAQREMRTRFVGGFYGKLATGAAQRGRRWVNPLEKMAGFLVPEAGSNIGSRDRPGTTSPVWP